MTDYDDLLGSSAGRSEHAEQNDALMAITALPNTMAYRQNTGQAWQGRPVSVPVGEYVRVTPGMKILADARPIDFGCPGAGDIVAARRGRAVQVEMKTATGRQRQIQQAFERVWTKAGGIYILARSAKEARDSVQSIES